MYAEIEGIIDFYSSWTINDVKNFGVRERRHWYKRVVARLENLRNVNPANSGNNT